MAQLAGQTKLLVKATCVHSYITSKRIELESPSCSGFEAKFKKLHNLTNQDFLAKIVNNAQRPTMRPHDDGMIA